MVTIALDPAMYHADMSVVEEIRKAAKLSYEHLELSPRSDWFFWHHYPKADGAAVAEAKQACKETGVAMTTLVPVFNWSSPDEEERRFQVRDWRRLLEIADDLECPIIVSELSGDPNQPRRSEHAFNRSMEELIPDFERYGIALNLEAHPYDFAERNDYAVQIIRGINKPWVNYVVEDARYVRDSILTKFEMAELATDPQERAEWLTFVVVGAGPPGPACRAWRPTPPASGAAPAWPAAPTSPAPAVGRAKDPSKEPVAGAGRTPSSTEEFATRYGYKKWTTDLDEASPPRCNEAPAPHLFDGAGDVRRTLQYTGDWSEDTEPAKIGP